MNTATWLHNRRRKLLDAARWTSARLHNQLCNQEHLGLRPEGQGPTTGPQKPEEVPVDDDVFLDAFHEHLDRLHNLARSLTGSAQDAEDLVSETCLLALRGWRRKPPDDPAAWFATICLNAARSSFRRRAARPVEVSADDWLVTQADPDADTPAAAMSALDTQRVRRAMLQLPAVQLEAITLMDLAGYTAAQTAVILDVPRGTVLARVHRGRKALARLLQGEEVPGATRR